MGIFDLTNLHNMLNLEPMDLTRKAPELKPLYQESLDYLANSNVKVMENLLLDYFGSHENAVKYGKDYVFEFDHGEFETNVDPFSNNVGIRFIQTCRLRLKTKEEIDGEV